MATTTKEIRDLIVDKLEAIDSDDSGAGAIFGQVFAYAQGDFTDYPVAVVRPTGGRGTEIDTHRNERIFTFEITLYQEQSVAGKTKEDADAIVVEAADKVIESFDRDKDLGGEVEIVKVISFTYDFQSRAGTYNFATFQVEAVVIVPNYEP